MSGGKKRLVPRTQALSGRSPGVEVHHLHQAVHAGIGAAGAQGFDGAVGMNWVQARSSWSCTVRPLGWLCQPS
jgi:hypothetical protein